MFDRDTTELKWLAEEAAFITEVTNKIPKEVFITDRILQHTAMMVLINIGEAAHRLSSEFKVAHTEIEWGKITGLRNIAAHTYRIIEFDKIWSYIKEDIPELEKFLASLK